MIDYVTSTTPITERDQARTPPSLFKKLDERFHFAFAVDPVDKITVWYYIFRSFGAAWNHYASNGAP